MALEALKRSAKFRDRSKSLRLVSRSARGSIECTFRARLSRIFQGYGGTREHSCRCESSSIVLTAGSGDESGRIDTRNGAMRAGNGSLCPMLYGEYAGAPNQFNSFCPFPTSLSLLQELHAAALHVQ